MGSPLDSARVWGSGTVLLAAAVACARHGSSPSTSTATADQVALAAAIASADASWERRADEAALQDALLKYEAAHELDPTNRHVLERLTRGWVLWGEAFTIDEALRVQRWSSAVEWGEQCLALNDDLVRRRAQGLEEAEALAAATPADVPCIYWTATALGKRARAQSLSKVLRHLPTVEAYVSKVDELEPSYFHYGPARYRGAYLAALPAFAGRDLERSAASFALAIGAAPEYLPSRVLRAEFLAVVTQDVALFDDDLEHVLTADPDAEPDAGITPENQLAQARARQLLARRAELFDREALAAAGPR